MNPRRTRRTFLTDLGRTAAGVVVVGFAGACSSDDQPVLQATAAGPTPAADPTAADSTPTADPATASDDATSADAGQIVPYTVDLDFVAAFVLVRGG